MVPQLPPAYIPVIEKLALTLVAAVLTSLASQLVPKLLLQRVRVSSQAHTMRMLTRNTVFLIGVLVVLSIWLESGANLTVAMGILGAGIAFASQEVIGSLAGYVNIVTGSLYHIGDRVRLGNVTGDVMDISILRTTVMEIGEWVHADQYSGRLVTVANRVVFSEPVYNYTHHFHFLWDEIMIPVTYSSDWRRATELMLEHAQDCTGPFLAGAEAQLEELARTYLIQKAPVQPTLYLVMTDNWIELTLRYIVEPRQRRQVRAQLHQELLQHFEQEPNITVASATFDIVGFPAPRHEPEKARKPAAQSPAPPQQQ